MTTHPQVGTTIGNIDFTVTRADVWPIDWSVGLDDPSYLDPDVAEGMGFPRMPMPVGSLVFFSHIDNPDWMDVAGIEFDKSLAASRVHSDIKPIFVGDHIVGRSTISDVHVGSVKDGYFRLRVTISTTYMRDEQVVLTESVTYSTRKQAQ